MTKYVSGIINNKLTIKQQSQAFGRFGIDLKLSKYQLTDIDVAFSICKNDFMIKVAISPDFGQLF